MDVFNLSASVGQGGENHPEDVTQLQKALNQLSHKIGLLEPLVEDGQLAADEAQSPTLQAIGLFQKNVLGFQRPDCCVDRNGKTDQAIKHLLLRTETPWYFLPKIDPKRGLSQSDFCDAAEKLGCEVAAIKAVSEVESAGSGFFESGPPCLLFEAHIFSRYSRHRFDDSDPDISSPTWDRSLYVGGEKEYGRLQKALMLDRQAALYAASYGRYQIMGFNHQAAGYDDVEVFVQDMFLSERNHLLAFTHFILSDQRLTRAIQSCDWVNFARFYNGSGYAENHYDKRLQDAYERFKA